MISLIVDCLGFAIIFPLFMASAAISQSYLPHIVKREWEKRNIHMWYRLLYGTISFLCFTWLLFTWGVIDNGKIKLIRMNDETVEASYEAGGINEQHQEKPKIALTFDDGPHPSSTPVLLDGLAGRNVKVTFFVIGEM